MTCSLEGTVRRCGLTTKRYIFHHPRCLKHGKDILFSPVLCSNRWHSLLQTFYSISSTSCHCHNGICRSASVSLRSLRLALWFWLHWGLSPFVLFLRNRCLMTLLALKINIIELELGWEPLSGFKCFLGNFSWWGGQVSIWPQHEIERKKHSCLSISGYFQ